MAKTPELPICPIHNKPGRIVFSCCIGAKGGQSKSRKKLRAATATIAEVNEQMSPAKARARTRKALVTKKKNKEGDPC